ncbi:alanine and arginine-rich domain-containing protein [Notamacropus eugenii]|uniref:alanine and arginine-rich domain-containing protein n=1 Tax=Notamacropus eugenii TaxID=9315 RepID=UPI003B66EEB4
MRYKHSSLNGVIYPCSRVTRLNPLLKFPTSTFSAMKERERGGEGGSTALGLRSRLKGGPGTGPLCPLLPGFPSGDQHGGLSAEAQEEDVTSSLLLEDLQRRLRSAFRSPSLEPGKQQQEPQQSWEGPRGRATAVQEVLRKARIDGALSWLRAELLIKSPSWIFSPMRFQNWQLAKTLVDLNLEMQQLKVENELSTASEYPTLGKITVSSE